MSNIDEMRSCVYSWLQSVRLGWKKVKHLEGELTALRERLDGLNSATGEGVSGSSTGGGLDDGIARLHQLESEWEEGVASASRAYVDALSLCERRMDTYAVWLHVIERMTWYEVGCELGYSESRIKQMRDDGIREIYGKMPTF